MATLLKFQDKPHKLGNPHANPQPCFLTVEFFLLNYLSVTDCHYLEITEILSLYLRGFVSVLLSELF